MLTKERIESNKATFLDLISSINIEDADIEGLKKFLEESDFFSAPATIRYGGSYEGGLCEYSLKTYYNLFRLAKGFAYETEVVREEKQDENGQTVLDEDTHTPIVTYHTERYPIYSEDTIKVVGLLHALSKANFYVATEKNKKAYSETGKFEDDNGKYDWEKYFIYSVRDASERETYGSKALNSFFKVSRFIPLSEEETMAIINQAVGMDKSETSEDVYTVLDKSPLTVLLHNAIMTTLYISYKLPRPKTTDEQDN